jgi:NAD(P)-dependent dehydrogenase (short-subunit alcohol dehydrogenase family)
LITGSSDGYGRATARELVRRGAEVYVHGRDPQRTSAVESEIGAHGAFVADLGSLDDVRRMSGEAAGVVDVLVNNAGLSSEERRVSSDGIELTFQVNHLAGFLLTLRLLRSGSLRRVINVVSTGQHPPDLDNLMLERDYHWQRAYRQSKLSQIMCTIELARRLGPSAAPTVNALHPGTGLATKMTMATVGHAGSVAETELGVQALTKMVLDASFERVTGRYFERFEEARAHETAYDALTRERLWDVYEDLVGERLEITGPVRP